AYGLSARALRLSFALRLLRRATWPPPPPGLRPRRPSRPSTPAPPSAAVLGLLLRRGTPQQPVDRPLDLLPNELLDDADEVGRSWHQGSSLLKEPYFTIFRRLSSFAV